jgi:hypothetical protein
MLTPTEIREAGAPPAAPPWSEEELARKLQEAACFEGPAIFPEGWRNAARVVIAELVRIRPDGSPELLAQAEILRLRAALNRFVAPLDAEDLRGADANARTALAAPPPDLSPLKELVAAATSPVDSDAEDLYDRRADIETGWKLRALASQRAAESVLAAYPCLGDPECE